MIDEAPLFTSIAAAPFEFTWMPQPLARNVAPFSTVRAGFSENELMNTQVLLGAAIPATARAFNLSAFNPNNFAKTVWTVSAIETSTKRDNVE
jgi:hypothetical protein